VLALGYEADSKLSTAPSCSSIASWLGKERILGTLILIFTVVFFESANDLLTRSKGNGLLHLNFWLQQAKSNTQTPKDTQANLGTTCKQQTMHLTNMQNFI
jgi:hypothetical protein